MSSAGSLLKGNFLLHNQLGKLALFVLLALNSAGADDQHFAKRETRGSEKTTGEIVAVLWREPVDIRTRDLLYGQGGKENAPKGTVFAFVKEDLSGTNPKFVVTDHDGARWKIKIGAEARPEVAADRIVWAAGYFTDDDYYLPKLQITGLPAKLHRGQRFFEAGGTLREARLQRMEKRESKSEHWEWKHSVFGGTRELNGLRVLMALINNWDLKDANNKVRIEPDADGRDHRIYYVADLGASFGPAGIVKGLSKSRGNDRAFKSSKFVTKVTPQYVDFATPSRATLLELANPPRFVMRWRLRWIGRHIPKADAKWMGSILARLTPEQIRDAFIAAGYSPKEVEDFAAVLEARIASLNDI